MEIQVLYWTGPFSTFVILLICFPLAKHAEFSPDVEKNAAAHQYKTIGQ